MKLEHILIPTDFSDSSQLALDYSAALREKFPVKITFLHVVEPFFGYGMEILPSIDVEATCLRSAESHLKKLAAAFDGASSAETVCLTGRPWHVICD